MGVREWDGLVTIKPPQFGLKSESAKELYSSYKNVKMSIEKCLVLQMKT